MPYTDLVAKKIGDVDNKAMFLTELEAKLIDDDKVCELLSPLKYYSKILQREVEAPTGFQTDLASVPRVPIAYYFWGARCHREAVVHDYLCRINSDPVVGLETANAIFQEAMEVRNKPWYIRKPMYWGVCFGTWKYFHKRFVEDRLQEVWL